MILAPQAYMQWVSAASVRSRLVHVNVVKTSQFSKGSQIKIQRTRPDAYFFESVFMLWNIRVVLAVFTKLKENQQNNSRSKRLSCSGVGLQVSAPMMMAAGLGGIDVNLIHVTARYKSQLARCHVFS